MISSVFARSAVRSRALARPIRSGSAYHWENVDGSVSCLLILFQFIFEKLLIRI